MTPKEKALKLCQEFGYLGFDSEQTGFYTFDLELSKKCAIICVDEIMSSNPSNPRHYNDTIGYWQEVKLEIEKL